MPESTARPQQIAELEAQIVAAEQAGREDDASRIMVRLLELDPGHPGALRSLGQKAYRRGDLAGARRYFQALVDADGKDPQQWTLLALACKGLKDDAAEDEAIRKALTLEPRNLLALVARANLLERQGKAHEAAIAHGAVAMVAPPPDRVHPDLRSSVAYSIAYRDHYDRSCGAFLDQYLEKTLRDFGGDDLRRFRDSVDIMVGRKMRYDSHPSHYFFPRLAPIEFFEREEFPWIEAVESATEAVRGEFLEVVRTEEGFSPYITYSSDQPVDQWQELNFSPRWSAFRLIEKGMTVADNAARCLQTMQLLATVTQPDQPGRSPNAMFSLLKPRTRIPPHTGVSNVRLVAHLPLVIPEGCGFRVGNETRKWIPGKAWVFDDTLEHEAWNDSDLPRAILIFDVWHPHLTPAERVLIGALAAGLNAFAGAPADSAL